MEEAELHIRQEHSDEEEHLEGRHIDQRHCVGPAAETAHKRLAEEVAHTVLEVSDRILPAAGHTLHVGRCILLVGHIRPAVRIGSAAVRTLLRIAGRTGLAAAVQSKECLDLVLRMQAARRRLAVVVAVAQDRNSAEVEQAVPVRHTRLQKMLKVLQAGGVPNWLLRAWKPVPWRV